MDVRACACSYDGREIITDGCTSAQLLADTMFVPCSHALEIWWLGVAWQRPQHVLALRPG